MSDVYSCNDPVTRSEGFTQAKLALAHGNLVVLPTDTVYGVAADAFDPAGVRRLLRAKGRGRAMPIPVLIGETDTLQALTTRLSQSARDLADRFWPGGLTLICTQQPSLHWDLGDSRGTVALRIPDHPDARELLLDNGPLAVSSANTTGEPPATTVEEARDMLGDAVSVYLDAGPTPGLIPSTIVDASSDVLTVVRLGVVSLAQLREVAADIELDESLRGAEPPPHLNDGPVRLDEQSADVDRRQGGVDKGAGE
ncbi:MAG: L-threonylcarbamoyladenylate synthase [Nocardioidaceae bacterium]